MNAVTISDTTNSYTLLIRDGILARLKKLGFFVPFKTFRRSPMHVVQDDELPYAAVYLLPEILEPWGDANAGEPRFTHSAQFGFSVIILNNDDDTQENQLDTAHWAIMSLLTDASLVGMEANCSPYPTSEPIRIEGVTRIARQHIYGTIGKSETPVAELRMQMTVTFHSVWPPVEKDDLKVIHVTTAFPIDGDTASTVQVQSEYDIPQN